MSQRVCVVLALAFVACLHPRRIGGVGTEPSDYSRATEDAEPGSVDMRSALSACVAGWNSAYKEPRARLFRELQRTSYLDHEGSILLEIGNSGFPMHQYALWEEEHFVRGLGSGHATISHVPDDRLRIEALAPVLESATGAASVFVVDGNCYFLTYRLHGVLREVAVYVRAAGNPGLQEVLELMTQEAEALAEAPQP